MNKEEFLTVLRKKLKCLPKQEREEAVAYYAEYIEDAGEEALVMMESPGEAARKIITEQACLGLEAEKKKGTLKTLWLVLLGIFAAPMAIPVAIGLAAVAFAVVLVCTCLVLCVLLAGIACVPSGILFTGLGIRVFFESVGNGLFIAGMGLGAVGAGILLTIGGIYLGKALVFLLIRMMGKRLKGGTNNETGH